MLFSSTYSTQRGELLIMFCNSNSAQNSSVGKQFAYGINSRTLFNSTYSTQYVELLATFRNANSAQKDRR